MYLLELGEQTFDLRLGFKATKELEDKKGKLFNLMLKFDKQMETEEFGIEELVEILEYGFDTQNERKEFRKFVEDSPLIGKEELINEAGLFLAILSNPKRKKEDLQKQRNENEEKAKNKYEENKKEEKEKINEDELDEPFHN